MLEIRIVVNDQGQMQLTSSAPSRLATIDVLTQAIRALVGDESRAQHAAKAAAPKVLAAPAGVLRQLNGGAQG